MRVTPIAVNKSDSYFGFGILEESFAKKDHNDYLCYDHRPGKSIDVRFGNVNGYGEGGYGNANTNWGSCCSPNDEICITIDYVQKHFLFELNGEKSFTRKLLKMDIDYVFAFDPYYEGTTFSVEFL